MLPTILYWVGYAQPPDHTSFRMTPSGWDEKGYRYRKPRSMREAARSLREIGVQLELHRVISRRSGPRIHGVAALA